MYIDGSETTLDIFFCVEKKKSFTVFSNFPPSLPPLGATKLDPWRCAIIQLLWSHPQSALPSLHSAYNQPTAHKQEQNAEKVSCMLFTHNTVPLPQKRDVRFTVWVIFVWTAKEQTRVILLPHGALPQQLSESQQ